MRGAIPPLPQYIFMWRCLLKDGNSFPFKFRTKIAGTGALVG